MWNSNPQLSSFELSKGREVLLSYTKLQSKLQQKPQNFPDHPIDTPLDPANQISQTITEIQKILIQNKLSQPESQVSY